MVNSFSSCDKLRISCSSFSAEGVSWVTSNIGTSLISAPLYKAILALEPCKLCQVFLSTLVVVLVLVLVVLFLAKVGVSKQLVLLIE